ncbi:MAG: ABC transporter substrate-binding protein, partial [Stellaceae bacterium]
MKLVSAPIKRRTILKGGLAIGALQVTSPFVVKSLAEETIRIGLDDPFTGTYAETGTNEKGGCELAVDQINAKGGILGRRVELISEDSTSADTGTAVQKAHKLIDRDKVNFLIGNVNSAMAIALGEVANQAGILHIVSGGHTDSVTGTDCHWNVFRVCSTTRMESNAVSATLFKKYGKRFYFITPDYAFGHTLQQGFEAALKEANGTEVGASLAPLGTTDFSSYLIKAQAAKPDVIIFLTNGQDGVNSLKQAVQFGLDKRFGIAGGLEELEVFEGLPPEARIGTWVFEWYWKQPNVPHVKEFVAEMRKRRGGKVPTARNWFGYVSAWTCYHAAQGTKSLDAQKMAKFLQNWKLPPEVALMPNEPFYREGDNQLMATLYVGHAAEK